eukprot:1142676-Pelagomonas_calceolata.AAC.6
MSLLWGQIVQTSPSMDDLLTKNTQVKCHAAIAGNECADNIAKCQASLKDNDLINTGIPGTGPGGKPFYNVAWLAWKRQDQVHLNLPPDFQPDVLPRL